MYRGHIDVVALKFEEGGGTMTSYHQLQKRHFISPDPIYTIPIGLRDFKMGMMRLHANKKTYVLTPIVGHSERCMQLCDHNDTPSHV